ncbi:FecCD family ABC transporter permease [Corynebacterium provencense]|uniref:FecCD family ABC transporter permease n=1 Tax=Corynebacterium provencense TaxID=1737425 RepID=UPI0021C40DA3|nr:iron ABC transporter permease [Corynebacterium provencense]MCI1255523.1 iron ABC transporter permease [Corynebacterium provencense]
MVTVLVILVVAVWCCSLVFGRTFYPPSDVWRVITGEQVSGASFTVGRLRLPRATLGLICGFSFGLGGVVFQTMLRNPLASPDIIGISSGASAAAVFSIVSLSLGGAAVSALAIVAALAVVIFVPVLLSQSRDLSTTQLGDDTAAALGVRVSRTRLVIVVAAVGLIAFATAAAGPVAFVAFLSGPVAGRLAGPGTSLLIPAALVGALLVLVADFCGQFAFDTRYPVGVVTGVLGAPYLIYLIIRTNRAGGSL